MEQFQKLNLLAFRGESDRIQAEGWIRQIEKILCVMECTESQKVTFATFMLQGEAKHWWEIVKNGAKYSG